MNPAGELRGGAPPMPVIVGAPRSGTTLLRFMLDAHPELAIPPETGFLVPGRSLGGTGDVLRERFFELITTFPSAAPAWNDFGISRDRLREVLREVAPFSIAEGYRAFYREYAARFGKARYGDKTPTYCLHLASIEQVLPEAHFIHVIRDGRDVALSLRETWFSPGADIDGLAEYWMNCVTTARRQGSRCGHYLEVRFEHLITDSAAVLTRISRFLALPHSPAMLDYYHRTPDRLSEHRERKRVDGTVVVSHDDRVRQQALTQRPPQQSRVQAWRTRMDLDERCRFEKIAGALLQELGY